MAKCENSFIAGVSWNGKMHLYKYRAAPFTLFTPFTQCLRVYCSSIIL